MSLADRLRELIKVEGTQAKFCEKTGLSLSTVTKALHRGTSLGAANLEHIALAYPHLNLRWLLTGEGSMWMDNPSTTAKEISPAGLPNERLTELLEQRVRELEREIKQDNPALAKKLGIK